MNPTVKRIVDLLFEDTVENEETNVLHEELMNNCQEHFEDLTAQGLSEDEAIGAVVESLKGMKDVLDEYPKKNRPEADGEMNGNGADDPRGSCQTFDAVSVNRLHVETVSNDVTVATAPSDRITVFCDDREKIRVEHIRDMLKIVSSPSENRKNEWKSFFDEPLKTDSAESFFTGILNRVQGVLNKAGVTISTGPQPPVRIELPEHFAGNIDISSRGGDVTLDGTESRSVNVHTVSGDIRVGLPPEHLADSLDLNSTSGDISMRGNGTRLNSNTISGDVEISGRFENVCLKAVSGDIGMTGAAGAFAANTVSGDIRVNPENPDLREIRMNSVSGDLHATLPSGITAAHTEITTRSGNRSCRFGDTGKDILPKIIASTVSGDVRID